MGFGGTVSTLLTGHMTLGKLLIFVVPQCPHPLNDVEMLSVG